MVVDRTYLQQALVQAERRKGFTAPNPAVGAVLVKDNSVLAVGTHWQAGSVHAEVDALSQTMDARGSTLYVTLEPCCHHGKTPPCSEAIIKAGVVRVVYGYVDPNPQVAGRGVAQLQAAGIVCEYLELELIKQFYRSYAYRLEHQLPWLCAKLAVTLDGKIANSDGQPLPITGRTAQAFTHQQRLKHEAILTSVRTIEQDSPQFNVRLPDAPPVAKPLIVIDRQARLATDASVWRTTSQIIVLHGVKADHSRVLALQALGAQTIAVAENDGQLMLQQGLFELSRLGFHDVWLEAGGTLFASFANQGLLNEAYCYVAPWWAGPQMQSAFSEAEFFKKAQRRQWWSLADDAVLQLEF